MGRKRILSQKEEKQSYDKTLNFLIKDFLKQHPTTKQKYLKIFDFKNRDKNRKLDWLTKAYRVGRRGYFLWVKRNRELLNKYVKGYITKEEERKLTLNNWNIEIAKIIKEVHKKHSSFGYKRISTFIEKSNEYKDITKGKGWSKNKVRRYCIELNLKTEKPKSKKGKPSTKYVEMPNKIWHKHIYSYTCCKNSRMLKSKYKTREEKDKRKKRQDYEFWNPKTADNKFYWIETEWKNGKIHRLPSWIIKKNKLNKAGKPQNVIDSVVKPKQVYECLGGEIIGCDTLFLTAQNHKEGQLKVFFVTDIILGRILGYNFYIGDIGKEQWDLLESIIKEHHYLIHHSDNEMDNEYVRNILKKYDVFQSLSNHNIHSQQGTARLEAINSLANRDAHLYRYYKNGSHKDIQTEIKKFVDVNNSFKDKIPESNKEIYEFHKTFIEQFLANRRKHSEWIETVIKTKDYCVIDVETTGLNESGDDEITEIGIVKVRNGKMVDEKSFLIKTTNKPPTKDTIKLNKITKQMLDKNGISFVEGYKQLEEFVDKDIIIGYNINKFDRDMLRQSCAKNKINYGIEHNEMIDVYWLTSGKLSQNAKKYNLGTQKHRALGDCELTHKLFEILKGEIAKENS